MSSMRLCQLRASSSNAAMGPSGLLTTASRCEIVCYPCREQLALLRGGVVVLLKSCDGACRWAASLVFGSGRVPTVTL